MFRKPTALLPSLASRLLALAVFFPTHASAQGLSLDLSDSAPDLRPGIAVLGIGTTKSLSTKNAQHLQRLTRGFSAAASKSGFFGKVLDPDQVILRLGDRTPDALLCASTGCFGELADELDVERVVSAQVSFDGTGPSIHLWGYDRGSGSVQETTVDSSSDRGKGFDARFARALLAMFGQLKGQLALIKVSCNVPSAKVMLGSRVLGKGSLEKTVLPGTYRLTASASDYLSYETEVTLHSAASAEVAATLAPKDPLSLAESHPTEELVIKAKPAVQRSLFERPGTYMALAGVVAAAVGIGFGATAKQTENSATDPGGVGILQITRQQMLGARREALIANILMGTGAALFAGGAVWVMVDPGVPVSGPREPEAEPGGFQVRAGGTF
jgi:hypothetical protein